MTKYPWLLFHMFRIHSGTYICLIQKCFISCGANIWKYIFDYVKILSSNLIEITLGRLNFLRGLGVYMQDSKVCWHSKVRRSHQSPTVTPKSDGVTRQSPMVDVIHQSPMVCHTKVRWFTKLEQNCARSDFIQSMHIRNDLRKFEIRTN